jgi:hypothetical protein
MILDFFEFYDLVLPVFLDFLRDSAVFAVVFRLFAVVRPLIEVFDSCGQPNHVLDVPTTAPSMISFSRSSG